ncbi:gamma-glutamylcyclotransferase family protein [Streptomyces sp. NPDC001315]|uniref:gamma-glutamylcyclotransferase family protein n=1 Tax=Streptomyces sp. NPDC001315 TaxID=3364562 RepID=UPI0036C5E996
MQLPFFVYGTLRPGEVNHDLFLRGRTRSEAPARLAGAVLYDGPGYPYAVEEPGVGSGGGDEDGSGDGNGSGGVRGELVTALPDAYAELLVDLDRLEEYAPGDPRNLYERVEREVVRVADGVAVRAWVYVAAPTVAMRLRARGRPIEGGDWLTRR